MLYTSVVIGAAKAVKVSASLLLAICNHESSGLKNVIAHNDGGSPSYGICQMKYETARMLGFEGQAKDLMEPKTNALYAAKYLKYQMGRYDNQWCKATAAYNAGTYFESKVVPGKPRNLKYVRRVQKQLDNKYRAMLSCSY